MADRILYTIRLDSHGPTDKWIVCYRFDDNAGHMNDVNIEVSARDMRHIDDIEEARTLAAAQVPLLKASWLRTLDATNFDHG